MKIHKFVIYWIVAFALMAVGLSVSFYIVERHLVLQTISDGLNRSIYRLEDDIRRVLETGNIAEAQKILDQIPAINHAVASVSVSISGEYIDWSSSRSLKGKSIGEQYRRMTYLDDQLVVGYSQFKSNFFYFDGAKKRWATLLLEVDEPYVFGRLNQIAIYYGLLIFFVIGFGSLAAFFVMRRLLILPLEKVTQHAHNQNAEANKYLIAELSVLDATLSDSFNKLRSQQEGLQTALDETLYLDHILRTVADVNQLLISSSNMQELLEKSTIRLAQHTGYDFCWLALEHESSIYVQAYSSGDGGHLAVNMVMAELINQPDDIVSQAFVQSKSIVVTNLNQHTSAARWQTVTDYGKSGSFIALPIMPSIYGKPIGVLGLYARNSAGLAQKEIKMLEELAGDIGFAVRAFKQREQLAYHLTTDGITGLPNRVSLEDQLATDASLTVAIINIDRFSDINDAYGSAVGDTLLVDYGRWLSGQIKTYNADLIGSTSLFKMGGDEFALVFRGWRDLDACCVFLKHIISASSKSSFTVQDIEMLLTVSIGVAGPSGRVLAHAASAIKQAKATRQELMIYAEPLGGADQDSNIAWYRRIKSAIDESRIVPFYQPIVDNKTRRIIKYEALMRLIELDGTVIGPYAFLERAKKMRMYGALTRLMVQKTCDIFKNSKIPVSINLSAEDLLNAELAEMLETIILTNHMGQMIVFEILESEGIQNYAKVSVFVDRFKSLGCRFAIDDFGSGYSNFDHLLKLSVDTIKIDGSLIKSLPHDSNARVFVKHICDFAHEMGISTVAEFVANEDIFQQVKEMGIDASQGYYFYEPSPTLVESL